MATLKTRRTDRSVSAFLDAIPDAETRHDCQALMRMMKRATKAEPAMWGPSIVGFGSYNYKYESGREGNWFAAGFSPRKQNLTLYIMSGFPRHAELMRRLGRYKTGKSCLYIKRLEDVDRGVLQELIEASVAWVASAYPRSAR